MSFRFSEIPCLKKEIRVVYVCQGLVQRVVEGLAQQLRIFACSSLLLLLFCFFKTGFLCVDLAVLELAL